MPRSRSSGALSIESNDRTAIFGFFCASTIVIAAVSVVFPWSTCPIVPTFTCGFVRSNFCLAIGWSSLLRSVARISRFGGCLCGFRRRDLAFAARPAPPASTPGDYSFGGAGRACAGFPVRRLARLGAAVPRNGAHDRNRTDDLLLTMEMLYRLSYVGFGRPGTLLRQEVPARA